MAKLLMRSGKFVNPDTPGAGWEIQANQVVLLHPAYIGQLFDVMDTSQGVIEWAIPMKRIDGLGADGELIPTAEIDPFG